MHILGVVFIQSHIQLVHNQVLRSCTGMSFSIIFYLLCSQGFEENLICAEIITWVSACYYTKEMMSLLHHPSRGHTPSGSSRSPSPLKTLPHKQSSTYLALRRWHLPPLFSSLGDNRAEEALEEHFFVLLAIWWRCYRWPYGMSLCPEGIIGLINPLFELSEGWRFTFCPTQ